MVQRRLPFEVVQASSFFKGFPKESLERASPTSEGWRSDKYCTYPQEITLRFKQTVHISKLQILAHEFLVPRKIEIFVGTPDGASPHAHSQAKYKRLGYLRLDENARSDYKARELKTVSLAEDGLFLRLVLDRCYTNIHNVYNQVSLIGVNVIGDLVFTPGEGGEYGVDGKKDIYSTQDTALSGQPAAEEDHGPEDMILDARFDRETAKRVRELMQLKSKAVETEDYDEAKRLKNTIDRLKEVGVQLAEMDVRKKEAVRMENYDAAKLLKEEIGRLRRQAEQPYLEQTPLQPAMTPQQIQQIQQQAISPIAAREHPQQQFAPQQQMQPQQMQPQQMQPQQMQPQQMQPQQMQPQQMQHMQPQHQMQPQQMEQREAPQQQMQPQYEQPPPPTVQMQRTPEPAVNPQDQIPPPGGRGMQRTPPPGQSPAMAGDMTQSQEEVAAERRRLELEEERKKARSDYLAKKKAESEGRKEDHDERVAATGKGAYDLDAYMEKVGDDQAGSGPGDLKPMDKKTRVAVMDWLDFIDEKTVTMVHSRQFQWRDQALDQLVAEFDGEKRNNQAGRYFQVMSAVAQKLLGDRNALVYVKAIEFADFLVKEFNGVAPPNEMKMGLKKMSRVMLAKDATTNKRVRTVTEDYMVGIASTRGLGLPYLALFESKKLAPKAVLWRLQILHVILGKAEIAGMGQEIIDYARSQLESANAQVRDAAVQVCAGVYSQTGPDLLLQLCEKLARPAIVEKIYNALIISDKENGTQPSVSLVNQKLVRARGGDRPIGGTGARGGKAAARGRGGKTGGGRAKKEEPSPRKPSPPESPKESISKELPDANKPMCQYCFAQRPSFVADPKTIDLHMLTDCPALCECPSCEKIEAIWCLTDHLIDECQGKEKFKRCSKCACGIPVKRLKKHEKTCKGTKPAEGYSVCPLCRQHIEDTQESWQRHLGKKPGCSQNPRTQQWAAEEAQK